MLSAVRMFGWWISSPWWPHVVAIHRAMQFKRKIIMKTVAQCTRRIFLLSGFHRFAYFAYKITSNACLLPYISTEKKQNKKSAATTTTKISNIRLLMYWTRRIHKQTMLVSFPFHCMLFLHWFEQRNMQVVRIHCCCLLHLYFVRCHEINARSRCSSGDVDFSIFALQTWIPKFCFSCIIFVNFRLLFAAALHQQNKCSHGK